jgi:glyoxalase family protein
MDAFISGIHHITAIATDAQKNINFYTGILGLRLVKKTVNFDAPDVYHLYYGDEKGSPGTILTFFPFGNIPKGRPGKGQVTGISFSIAEQALSYWMQRLKDFNISYQGPQQRFNETVLHFEDPDGLALELVANAEDTRQGFTEETIPQALSIKGFYGATLSEECYEKTAGLLVGQLNHQLIAEKGNRFRYSASGKPGDFIDVLCTPDILKGLGGYGTVHHLAFATASDDSQKQIREKLLKLELNITPVLDRQYFHSIYFREPGGVLFEVATVPPGFMVDEPLEELGQRLKLPSWLEQDRSFIEKSLPPLHRPPKA